MYEALVMARQTAAGNLLVILREPQGVCISALVYENDRAVHSETMRLSVDAMRQLGGLILDFSTRLAALKGD